MCIKNYAYCETKTLHIYYAWWYNGGDRIRKRLEPRRLGDTPKGHQVDSGIFQKVKNTFSGDEHEKDDGKVIVRGTD